MFVLNDDYFGLSFDIIYRNFFLYEEFGILEIIELFGEKFFWFKCLFIYYYYYFICFVCGKIKEIELCLMDKFCDDLDGY